MRPLAIVAERTERPERYGLAAVVLEDFAYVADSTNRKMAVYKVAMASDAYGRQPVWCSRSNEVCTRKEVMKIQKELRYAVTFEEGHI